VPRNLCEKETRGKFAGTLGGKTDWSHLFDVRQKRMQNLLRIQVGQIRTSADTQGKKETQSKKQPMPPKKFSVNSNNKRIWPGKKKSIGGGGGGSFSHVFCKGLGNGGQDLLSGKKATRAPHIFLDIIPDCSGQRGEDLTFPAWFIYMVGANG